MYRFNYPHVLRIYVLLMVLLITTVAPCVAVTPTPSKTPITKTTPTPSKTPTPTPTKSSKLTPTPTSIPDELSTDKTATVNQNLKRMIDKVVEQNKEKVRARLQEIGSRRRGFVGEVKSIREGAMTLRTKTGTQVIPTDQGVEMLKANKIVTADKISVGDWAVVIGATKDDAFIAETIEFLASSPRPKTHFIQLGTLVDFKKSSLTFKSRKSGEEKNFVIDKNTTFLDSTDQKTSSSNFSANVQVLLIANQDENSAVVLQLKALAPFTKLEPTKKPSKN